MENRKNTGLRVLPPDPFPTSVPCPSLHSFVSFFFPFAPPRHCTQKRKLPKDGTVQEQEPAIKEMCQALKEMESELQNLRDDNNQLRDELLGKDRQLAETRTVLVDREHKLSNTQALLVDREQQLAAQTLVVDSSAKEFETEILRLKRLLAEKSDTNDHTALVSPETINEVIQKQTPVSSARTPASNRMNTVQSSVKAIAHHGSFQDEARSGTDENSRSCVYHMLLESLVGMKFSLKDETEGLSLSIHHEATGYDFSLTWLEQPDGGEWAYKYSSLGTLEEMALKWMKVQDIRLSMDMLCTIIKVVMISALHGWSNPMVLMSKARVADIWDGQQVMGAVRRNRNDELMQWWHEFESIARIIVFTGDEDRIVCQYVASNCFLF
uniref:DUF7806 domain-containing protein n=1 Tax=Aegilops tauschii TaxID=37682 RepID=M8CA19_AEGTA